MKILFLHGWTSVPGGLKPTYLKDHGHTVLNPALDDDDFEKAVQTAQAEFDQHQPDVIVGSSRGGAVAMNIESKDTPLVLLCPAWKRWGSAKTIKRNTTILHSRQDDVVPFDNSEELVANSDIPSSALIEIGNDHRLADREPLEKMLEACLGQANRTLLDMLQELSASEIRWAAIEPLLEGFQSLLSPSVPKLEIEREADVLNWRDKNGVYLLFGDDEQLLYIGYTLNGFASRVNAHKREFEYKWVDLIIVPEEIDFFAPALETYLRQQLSAPYDGGGKHI